jgi:hypothetical protein
MILTNAVERFALGMGVGHQYAMFQPTTSSIFLRNAIGVLPIERAAPTYKPGYDAEQHS